MTGNEQSLFWIEPATLTGLLTTVSESAMDRGRTPRQETGRTKLRTVPPSTTMESALSADSANNSQAAWRSRAALVLPRRPFEARLAALLGWLEHTVAFEQAFVIDVDGLPLIEEQTVAELLAAAAALGRTWQTLQRSGELEERASLTLELGANGPRSSRRLYLLAAATRWGLLQLGFVTERLLGSADLAAARDAFHRTVDDKEYDRS